VDRSGAYAARWVAKNVVAAGLARRCAVQVAYAIGVAQPVSIVVDTPGEDPNALEAIGAAVRAVFDLSPAGIIRDLDLLRPIYSPTACLGHFGPWRDPAVYRWERTDRAGELRRAFEGYLRIRRNGLPEPEPDSLAIHHEGAA
jgi:S-adenosylmethionine synthetase